MKPLLSVCLLAGALLLSQVQGQTTDPYTEGCPLIERSNLTELIAMSYKIVGNPTPPVVNLDVFNIVCLSASRNRDMWRGVSVVAKYSCVPETQCGSGPVTMQFDFSCLEFGGVGQWQLNVLGVNLSSSLRTTPVDPDPLMTQQRRDCSICATANVTASTVVSQSVDAVTHCVACPSECDEGLMWCQGFATTFCCNYYQNDRCIKDCSPSHVINNATFDCECPGLHTGSFCTDCTPDCQNGGTPPDPLVCDTCTCPQNYMGTTCEEDVNECNGNPCANSGTCLNEPGSFRCQCSNGFVGSLCEEDICTTAPCMEGGTCSMDQASSLGYKCDCTPGYHGSNCERDSCDPNPCNNSGSCTVNSDGSFNCNCISHWAGITCSDCGITRCARCGSVTGDCAECQEGFVEGQNGVCECPPGKTAIDNSCVDVGTSDNTCQVTNCLTCEIGTTTRCVRCVPGFVVNTTTNVCDVSEDSGGGGGGDDSGRTIDELVLVGLIIACILGFVVLIFVTLCVMVGVVRLSRHHSPHVTYQRHHSPQPPLVDHNIHSHKPAPPPSAKRNPLFLEGGMTKVNAYYEENIEFTAEGEEFHDEGDDISLTRIDEEEEEVM